MNPAGIPDSSRRGHPRYGGSITVQWECGRHVTGSGSTTNLSLGGFCLRTRTSDVVGHRHLFCFCIGDRDVTVEGEVTWQSPVELGGVETGWRELGVQLCSTAPTPYLDLVRNQGTGPAERRQASRLRHRLYTQCRGAGGTFHALSVDISDAGIRLEGDVLPREGEGLLIELVLPGNAEPLALRGKVLRVVPPGLLGERGQFVATFIDHQQPFLRELCAYLDAVQRLMREDENHGNP